jgi:hypothetical protein
MVRCDAFHCSAVAVLSLRKEETGCQDKQPYVFSMADGLLFVFPARAERAQSALLSFTSESVSNVLSDARKLTMPILVPTQNELFAELEYAVSDARWVLLRRRHHQ